MFERCGFIQCRLNVIIYEDMKQKLASVRAKTEAAAGQAYNPSTRKQGQEDPEFKNSLGYIIKF